MIQLQIHSPIEEISNPLFEEKGVRLYVKRDDQIHPFISGNKWRKLKYLLREAEKRKKKHLVTFGGAYSNHLVATACAGAKFGFRTTGFVRGEVVTNHSLMLCKLFGMELQFISREAYRDKKAVFDMLEASEDAMFVDEGGAGQEAVQGCSELIGELDQKYDHIFCAAGTGTTAAGILKGISQDHLKTQLHVVPVLKNGSFIANDILKYQNDSVSLNLHSCYHFGGYAKTTPELLAFIKDFASSTGILLDQVYTGKMAYAAFDLIRNDYFMRGSKILLIHTGGLLGLLSQAEKIA